MPLTILFQFALNWGSYDYDGPSEVLKKPFAGDWIVRKDAPVKTILNALKDIYKEETGKEITFTRHKIETEKVIAKGKYNFLSLPNVTDGKYVLISTNKTDIYTNGGGGTGTLNEFLSWVANRIKMDIIDETESSDIKMSWRNHDSSDLRKINDNVQRYNQQLDLLLKNLSLQTGLTFERTKTTTEKWSITENGIDNNREEKVPADVQAGTEQEKPVGRRVDNSAFFTQPVTRNINSTIEQKDCFIDFDNNKLFSPPADFDTLKSEQQKAWKQKNGVDAISSTSEGGEGLWGEQMVVIPVANEEFTRMNPSSFRNLLQQATPASPAVMTAIGELPKTYLFKTREGGMGLLQILEVQNKQNPNCIKIRYKMVPHSTESDARITSDRKIQDLGKVMVLYCTKHQGNLPDSLQNFVSFMPDNLDIDWLSKHVEYLGKGKTENDRPDTIIAYDKSLLQSQQGTNVLFLDGHVEFVEAEKLKESGIGQSAVQIEMRLLQVGENFPEEVSKKLNFKLDSNTPLEDIQVDSFLKAVQADKDTKMLAAPKVTVLDDQEAQLFIGQEVPSISGYTIAEEPKPVIEYKRIGIICDLTPHVSPDGQNVFTELELEFNQLTGFEELVFQGIFQEQVPQFQTNNIVTSKTIPDDKTLFFDGGPITIYEKKEATSTETNSERTPEKKRLIILIKPSILSPEQAEQLGLDGTSFPATMGGYGGYGQGDLPPGFGGSGYGTPPPEMLNQQSTNQQTTEGMKQNNMVNRVYDITDLVGIKRGEGDGGYGGGIGGYPGVLQNVNSGTADQNSINAAQEIINHIKKTIEPDSWQDNGGSGTIIMFPSVELPKKLAIYQSVQVHQKIQKFIDSMRQTSGEEFIENPGVSFPKNWDEIKRQAEPAKTEPNEPELSNQIMIYTRIIKASDEFLKFVGLDENSLQTSDTWSKYLVTDSNDSPCFIIDKLNADLLAKTARARKDIEMHTMPSYCLSGKQVTTAIADQKYYILRPPAEPNNPAKKRVTEFLEVGTSIQLLPKLMEDRKNIQLDYAIKFNNLEEFQEAKIGGQKKLVPKISTSKETSRNLIPNDKTLLICGEKITRTTSGNSRTPILGDLPLIGEIFRSQYKITEEYTPLILIKPSILSQQQIEQMHPAKPIPIDPNDRFKEQLEEHLSR